MRNLKKVLSLALCLVMLLGMMVVGAGAATEYADSKDITKTEAVGVMSELGILKGSNGSFNPKGELKREQAAKIMVYVRDGAMFAEAVGKTQGENTFSDVAVGHWASGYVTYCANQNIIVGSNGKFRPGDPVKVQEFAKMLLVAMGSTADYTGAGWVSSVQRDALKIGLNENVDITAWNAPIDRQNASQMAFNALTKTLEGESGYILTDEDEPIDDNVYATLNDAVLAKLAAGTTGNDWVIKRVTSKNTLGAKNYGLKPDTYTDGLGNTYNTWTVEGEDEPIYVAEEPTEAAKVTYTKGGVTADDVKKDAGVASATVDAEKVFINGEKQTGADIDITTKCGDGKIVQVFVSNKAISKVNVINKTIAKLAANPVVATNGNISIASLGMSNVKPENVKGDVDALAKGDIVLFVKDAKNVWHIEKLEPAMTGKVTGNSSKGALIDGKYYKDSDLTANASITKYADASIDNDAEYNFYLDDGGFIVFAEPVTEGTASESNYAVVLKTSWVPGTTTGVIGEAGTKGYLQAQILKTDGTTEVVTVASVNGFVPVALPSTETVDGLKTAVSASTASHAIYNASDFAATNGTVADTTTNDDTHKNLPIANGGTIIFLNASTYAASAEVGRYMIITDAATTVAARAPADNFYSYKVNSKGEYELSTEPITGDDLASVANNASIESGKVAFQTGKVGNANTVFLYAVTAGGKTEYAAYTGIANIPGVKYAADDTNQLGNGGSAKDIVTKGTGGVAKFVYVKTTGTTAAAGDVVYILNTNKTTLNTKPVTYVYDAIVNGEVTTITTDKSSLDVKFYDGGKDDKGVYTTMNDLSGSTKTNISFNEGGVLMAGGTAYNYKSGTTAWYYDGEACAETTADALSLDATDLVYVKTDANSNVEAVYVIAKNDEPSAVTVTALKANGTDASDKIEVADLTDDGQANANSDLVAGDVKIAEKSSIAAGEAVGHKIKVTATAVNANTSCTVSIDGGAAANGATGVTYTLAAGAAKDVTVSVVVTDRFSQVVSTYEYTLSIGAITAAG